ncbi:TetR/AcrR family transcriptional regulator [Paractinoplanes hotanensis]|uniref:TetR/AcrR family transcriptional regulator n=1 Tax=Paractinoplanes hotanensis TaxID=2906497 RepID=A0ABT0Y7Z9_9ACTN|nr:helix-turn-helix domain-containing protein [Actinoplanes hotanensis]MCM4082164.1 TetR/AcrR family transcriptional regulator [Actinoplanes hotanensis]
MTAVRAADSRQRFVDAAIRLFARHSFAGTSLQMIADEVGVTKSAVHHHFHTREELLTAVVEPLAGELRATVMAAETQRTRRARAERMLSGFIDVVIRNRVLVPVLAGDPGATEILRSHADWNDLGERLLKLLADVDPGVGGWIKADLTVSGIACGRGMRAPELDDDLLREHLIGAGRRILGLRAPRCLR